MSNLNNEISDLNIKELFNSKVNYIIPIYQRNYAWEAKEIEQLIQDIIDYAKQRTKKNYYLGTLVVAKEQKEESTHFSTIDGQQRLTTLSILSSVIKNEFSGEYELDWFTELNLRFSSRENSSKSLEAAFNGSFGNEDYEANIKAAYEICKREIAKRTQENKIPIEEFASYLYVNVKILRVQLPEGTDLNHYFEIMNSRGEQLEKHEILKAKLLDCFNVCEEKARHEYSSCFNLIWEACSNMEKYVQYGFTTEQRHLIFGDKNWNTFLVLNFDDILKAIKPTLSQNDTNKLTIDKIINKETITLLKTADDDSPDRFNSVVNFQNFLLHVLRVQTAKDEVALDDKRLLDVFLNELPTNENDRVEFVKKFAYNLLKCKLLFDKYIIKREFTANTDRWSLKSLKWYSSGKVKNGVKYVNTFGDEQNDSFNSDNRRILMLLSMFHVSQPSMSYKYWLNAALNYLFNQFDIDSDNYVLYLEYIAKAFVFDKYLAVNPKDYFDIIHKDISPTNRKPEALNLTKLAYEFIENNLVFNFLDYLLWIKLKENANDKRIPSFEYTFRSSVEHYYPQHPINNAIKKISEEYLHLFGNLCLISHEKNSRLSNLTPISKKDYYQKSPTLDSLKQYIMMQFNEWSINEIENHNNEMIQLLIENMNSGFSISEEVSLAKKWFKEYQINNKVLLARALLCFEDYPLNTSGDKFNLFNFDHKGFFTAFEKLEKYVNKYSPDNLEKIVSKYVQSDKLETDYRYLFIKYPEIIDYCKEGNFIWKEDGKLIYLLESEKSTKNKSKELYTFLIEKYFYNEYRLNLYTDYEAVYIKIGYLDESYFITEEGDETSFELLIWNEQGKGLYHSLHSYENGNNKSVKLLSEYRWEKNIEGKFERLGKPMVLKLGNNFNENYTNSINVLLGLLKNGFGIKMKQI